MFFSMKICIIFVFLLSFFDFLIFFLYFFFGIFLFIRALKMSKNITVELEYKSLHECHAY